MHKPVLLKEVFQYLNPQEGDFVIDGTINGGGHAKAILEYIGPKGKLLGIDWDESLIVKSELRNKKNVLLVAGNYTDIPHILENEKLPKANALLLDLGFSSEQLEGSGRGFSFKKEYGDEPLLMTYSDESEPVKEIVSRISEEELTKILRDYGGERYARVIAKAIIAHRRKKKIATVGELAEVVHNALPKNYERGRIDPATRTFQALRIYANRELENISRLLAELPDILVSCGRAAIITFHSLEDRIVKNAFRDGAKAGTLEILTKKPIAAEHEEIMENPRARSAKLRIACLL